MRSEEEDCRDYVSARLEHLRRVAYLLCHDWYAADDLVSTVLLKLFASWRKARRADNLDAYVRGMLTNAWLDERRRPWRREWAEASVPERAVAGPEPSDRRRIGELSLTLAPSASPAPRADRLLRALQAAIIRTAPQVRGVDGLREYVLQCSQGGKFAGYDEVPAGPGVAYVPCPGPSAGLPQEPGQYVWKGELTSPSGTYGIEVTISSSVYVDPSAPPAAGIDAAERQAAREQDDAPERGPGGEHITVDGGLLNLTKRDGTGIVIATWDTNKEGAYRTRSPFTVNQLKAIGLDPALRF